MNATIDAIQSRLGFHVCSFEDYKKIKLLHKHYWIAAKKKAAYDRYYRKEPQNRVIRKQNKVELVKPIPMPKPVFPSIYNKILRKAIVPFYQQARHPHPTLETVRPLMFSMKQVDEWLSEIESM